MFLVEVKDAARYFFASKVQRKDKGFWTVGLSRTDVEEVVYAICKHSGELCMAMCGDVLAEQHMASVWERRESEDPLFLL